MGVDAATVKVVGESAEDELVEYVAVVDGAVPVGFVVTVQPLVSAIKRGEEDDGQRKHTPSWSGSWVCSQR